MARSVVLVRDVVISDALTNPRGAARLGARRRKAGEDFFKALGKSGLKCSGNPDFVRRGAALSEARGRNPQVTADWHCLRSNRVSSTSLAKVDEFDAKEHIQSEHDSHQNRNSKYQQAADV
jgi:hypothetical protein